MESRLLVARDEILARARTVTEEHARRVAAARDHALDRTAAAAALEAIAKTRSYRLGGHASFEAFLQKEIGISRATAHRLRALVAAEVAPRREADAAAVVVRKWLRARGIRSASVGAGHTRIAPLEIDLEAGESAYEASKAAADRDADAETPAEPAP